MSDLQSIKNKLVKLLRLGECAAATPGEVENAFRIASEMMARHSLTRDDIDMSAVNDAGLTAHVSYDRSWAFTKNVAITACENKLAHFATRFIGTVRWYKRDKMTVLRNGLAVQPARYATGICFFGPAADALVARELFEELRDAAYLLSGMRYGNWSRGNGAAYSEGFADGVAAADDTANRALTEGSADTAGLMIVVAKNQLALRETGAKEWLASAHGIRLVTGRAVRSHGDGDAKRKGYSDGKNYDVGGGSLI